MQTDFELFLIEKRLAQNTRDHYRDLLGKFSAWLSESGLAWETVDAVQAFGWLDSKGWGNSWSYTATCAIRGYAVWKWGKSHPLAKFKMRREEPPPQRTLKLSQVQTLASSIQGNSDKAIRDRAILALLLDTGIRAFELCGLLVKNLDLTDKTANCLTKNRRWQWKVFTSQTATLLSAWLSVRDRIAEPGLKTVFCSVGGLTPGKALTVEGLRVIIRRRGIESGIGIIGPHDMRRTMATLAIRNGAPSRIV